MIILMRRSVSGYSSILTGLKSPIPASSFIFHSFDDCRTRRGLHVDRCNPLQRYSTSPQGSRFHSPFQRGIFTWRPTDLTIDDCDSFSRYSMVPAAIATHLSLGSVFAWSVFNKPLTHAVGVVAPSNLDWTLSEIIPIFSTTMATFGLSAFLLGRSGFYEWAGPRLACLLGAASMGSGWAIGALGISMHNLELTYLGYGILGGSSMGLAYVPSISNIVSWFPDKKGLAAGMAVGGYGAGGALAVLCSETLLDHFSSPSEMIGVLDTISLINQDGVLFANTDGILQEVVVSGNEVYLVGTGSTGLVETWLTLGALYSSAIASSSFVFKIPKSGWYPQGHKNIEESLEVEKNIQSPLNISEPKDSISCDGTVQPAAALRTPQFWALWLGMGLNCTAAYALIGNGKGMMMDTFGTIMPDLVTATFCGGFVSMISAFNLGGRVAWGIISDAIGRKPAFYFIFGLGIPLFTAMPAAIHVASENPALQEVALGIFYGSAVLTISCFGACAAQIPAYISDLYGQKYQGAIHGQILSQVAVFGFVGPVLCATLRDFSERAAIHELVQLVPSEKFIQAFGASSSSIESLIDAKTVSIARLMNLVPPGTPDPTPFLYDQTLLILAGFSAVTLGCNTMIKKIDDKFVDK